jgi:hypothetical protein
MKQANRADIAAMIEGDPIQTYQTHFPSGVEWLKRIPAHCQPGLARFVILGIKPGSFLCAVLAGEKELAERKADDINAPALKHYESFLFNGCPSDAVGSPKAVRAWCERGGLMGHPRKAEG